MCHNHAKLVLPRGLCTGCPSCPSYHGSSSFRPQLQGHLPGEALPDHILVLSLIILPYFPPPLDHLHRPSHPHTEGLEDAYTGILTHCAPVHTCTCAHTHCHHCHHHHRPRTPASAASSSIPAPGTQTSQLSFLSPGSSWPRAGSSPPACLPALGTRLVKDEEGPGVGWLGAM